MLKIAGILFLLGVLLLFIGGGELSLPLMLTAIGLIVVWGVRTDDARKHLIEYSPEFHAIADETDATKQETDRLKSLVEKIDFIERYHP